MKHDFRALSVACTVEQFTVELNKITKNLEFDYFAYGLMLNVPITAPKIQLVNNYTDKWSKVYEEKGYLKVDPTVTHGMRSTMPTLWDTAPSALCRENEFWEDAKSHDLEHGWAQSIFSESGISGMLTLARGNQAISAMEIKEKEPVFLVLNQIVHAKMKELFQSETNQYQQVRLTPKEREILMWIAEGKCVSIIAQILNLSESGIRFHLTNIMKKLNSSNITAAAVRAIMLGLLK